MSHSPSKVRRALVGAGIIAVVLGIVYVVLRMGPLAATQVTVQRVERGVLTPSVSGIGTVEARQSWLLGPTQAGRVLKVHVDVGQAVAAGQLLAEMDPVDLDQRVQAQQAALAKARSSLNTTAAQVDDAQARRELANANLRRQRDLARQNFISPSAVEGREQEVKSADAALQGAQANLQAARQEVQRLQAEGAAAERQRQNTRLLAPAAAVVISRDAEPGSTVVAGQPVLRLANPASLWVKLRVDQSRSAGLQTGLPAQIVLRSDARQTLADRVQRVELQADAVTEERIAQVAFDQIPATLSMGEMAEVTLTLPPLEQVLVVPQASVQTYQGRSGVWRLEQGTLAFAPVRLGASSLQGQVQVLDGLQTDDTVVVYSEKPLSPGARFRVVDRLVRQGKP